MQGRLISGCVYSHSQNSRLRRVAVEGSASCDRCAAQRLGRTVWRFDQNGVHEATVVQWAAAMED